MGVLHEGYTEQFPVPRRGWIAPAAVAAALALAAVAWFLFVARRDVVPQRIFDSPDLGCRFTYPSRLVAGPNFVRSRTGAVLTVERHSLFEAQKEFVRDLPASLFPQVRIQLDQVFRGLADQSQRQSTLGGRPALQVELTGRPGTSKSVTRITVDIAATEDWVYVLRATIPDGDVERDRADFDFVRKSFEFRRDGAPPPVP